MEIVTKSYMKVRDSFSKNPNAFLLLNLTNYFANKSDGRHLVHIEITTPSTHGGGASINHDLVSKIKYGRRHSSHIIKKKGDSFEHITERYNESLVRCTSCPHEEQCFSGNLSRECNYTLPERIDIFCKENEVSEENREMLYKKSNLPFPGSPC